MDTTEEKILDAHEIAYYSIRGTSAIENVDKIEKAIEKYAQSHTNDTLDKLEERVQELEGLQFENIENRMIPKEVILDLIQDLKQ